MKKIFFIFMFLAIFLSQAFATCLNIDSNNHNSSGKTITQLNGATDDKSLCIEGFSANYQSSYYKKDYYSFRVQTAGTLTITTSSPNNHKYHLKVGTPNDNNEYYGDERAKSHFINPILLSAGDKVIISIKETGNDKDKYKINFNFEKHVDTPIPSSDISTGTCYAMSDDSKTFYSVTMNPDAQTLPAPIAHNMSNGFNGEGSAYRASNNKIYAFKAKSDDKGPSTLYSIDVTNSNIDKVKNNIITGAVDGAEFFYDRNLKKEIFYVISGEDDTKLYAFDTTNWSKLSGYPKNVTGDITGISSIAIDPISGEAYGIDDYNYDDKKPILYKIDLDTAVATQIVQLDKVADAEGLAFASDGNLYIEDETHISGRKIYKVDLSDGSLIPAAILGGYGDIEGLSCNGMELADKNLISGYIYDDKNSDGEISEKIGIENAKVSIYDENKKVIDTTYTDDKGVYKFFLVDGNYSVVVDSKTLSTVEDSWMEQTYASIGGICDETPLTENGSCFGGKRGNFDDDNSSLDSAEHIIFFRVSGNSKEDINFGFSYNSVVNTNDSGQGSLRQFIKNANAIDGANVMKFSPSVSKNQDSWWSIRLKNPLPSITGKGTVIDGSTTNNDNSGIVENSHGKQSVGTKDVLLPTFDKPELEINADNKTSQEGIFVLEGDNIVIKHIALYNMPNGSGVLVNSGKSSLITENFIGSRADGTTPVKDKRLRDGIFHKSQKAVEISKNFIAYIKFKGIWADNNAYISLNSLYKASNEPLGDAITTELSNGDDIIIENNIIQGSSAYGIESWNSPSKVTIRNNTLIANGQDTSSANMGENGGIRVYGEDNTIEFNIIRDHVGAAIVITGEKKGNKISQNSLYNNGALGIDIDYKTSGNRNGDGVSINNSTLNENKTNNDMDYPVFTSAKISENSIYVKGYVGTSENQRTFSNSIVEVFLSDDNTSDVSDEYSLQDNDTTKYIVHAEGKTYLGSCQTNDKGNFACSFPISSELNITTDNFIVSTATGSDNSTSEFGPNMSVSHELENESGAFTCDNTIYLSNSNILGVGENSNDMYLHSIDISKNPFEFPAVGSSYNKRYNALAYNGKDDYLYALNQGLLLKIDKSGSVYEVGDIEGITTQHYSGAFDKDGYYYVGNWHNKKEILKIDIEKREIVEKISFGTNIEYWDMTITNDGFIYFVSVNNGKLVKINIETKSIEYLGSTYSNDDKKIASIYSDVNNRLFIILNNGGFYEVDATTGKRYFISTTPKLSGLNDGANCPNASLTFYDIGDAPRSYGEAQHIIIQTLKLGNLIDHEQNASSYFSDEANGDDSSGIDDEDAIDTEDLNNLTQSMSSFSLTVNVTNKTGITSYLRGWIDFDLDGHFDSDEMAEILVENDEQKVTLTWQVTNDIKDGKSYLRLRLSDQDHVSSKSLGIRGEVEDYTLSIKPRPKLDAWDTALSINDKMIYTKKSNESIKLVVASLNPKGDAFMTTGFKNIKATLFAEDNSYYHSVTAPKDVNLNDSNLTIIDFGKVAEAYKKVFVTLEYEDDFNITREVNATDIFSIRPDKYELELPSSIVAGKDFNISVKAVDVDGLTIQNYNEDASVYKLDINETLAGSLCILGDVDIKEKRAFNQGVSTVTINYNEVGSLKFKVSELNTTDTEFAHVDYSDGSGDGRFISNDIDTSAEINPAKIVPIYKYETINDKEYTYYSKYPEIMGAILDINISVKNDLNQTVVNYKSGCYAKDIDISFKIERLGENSSAIFSDNLGVVQNNISATNTSFNYKLLANSFDDGLSSKALRVNFDRDVDKTKTPLSLKIKEAKAKIFGVLVEDNQSIDKKIDFIYARAHAPQNQTVVGKVMDAKIDYEVYLPKSINRADFGFASLEPSEDDVSWYKLPNDSSFGFTNPRRRFSGLTISGVDNKTMKLTADKVPHNNRIDFNPKGYLMFNIFNSSATHMSFSPTFYSDKAKWSGKGQHGLSVKNDASKSGVHRIDW